MSPFIDLFPCDMCAGSSVVYVMLACELEKVALSGRLLGKRHPFWDVVGDGCSVANKTGFGPVCSLALELLCSAHTSQLSAVPDGALLLCW